MKVCREGKKMDKASVRKSKTFYLCIVFVYKSS